jgi:hypothetical protein
MPYPCLPFQRPRLGQVIGLFLAALAPLSCDQASAEEDRPEQQQAALVSPPSETHEQAARRRLDEQVARRKRVDDMKAELEKAVDSPERRTRAAALRTEYEAEVAATEGIRPDLRGPRPPEPKGMSEAQRRRLLAKMAAFDMRDPAQAREWARIKHEELGR